MAIETASVIDFVSMVSGFSMSIVSAYKHLVSIVNILVDDWTFVYLGNWWKASFGQMIFVSLLIHKFAELVSDCLADLDRFLIGILWEEGGVFDGCNELCSLLSLDNPVFTHINIVITGSLIEI